MAGCMGADVGTVWLAMGKQNNICAPCTRSIGDGVGSWYNLMDLLLLCIHL